MSKLFMVDTNPGKWYAQVAMPLLTTMVLQFIVPPAMHMVNNLKNKLVRHLKRRGALTQNALVRLYDTVWPVAARRLVRRGAARGCTSVTLVYSSALPMRTTPPAYSYLDRA